VLAAGGMVRRAMTCGEECCRRWRETGKGAEAGRPSRPRRHFRRVSRGDWDGCCCCDGRRQRLAMGAGERGMGCEGAVLCSEKGEVGRARRASRVGRQAGLPWPADACG
jgi:hypothetical protein